MLHTQEECISFLNDCLVLPTEDECIEFKEARNNFDMDDIGRYFSALSNEANLRSKDAGWLIFGVSDRLPRAIKGTNYRNNPASLQRLKQEIAQQTGGITFNEIYEVVTENNYRVILFEIPPAMKGHPTTWKGHMYGRNGESLAPLHCSKISTILGQSSDSDWTAELCAEATIQDLDPIALSIARQKFISANKRISKTECESWSMESFLEKSRLMRNGKLTRAALLLLGKPESIFLIKPHPARITWKLETEEQAYEHFDPPFIISINDIISVIRNIKFRFQPIGTLIPLELDKYDNSVILEALCNCIAHQDYSKHAKIIVEERVDRLVFINAGNFYFGSVEDYVIRDMTPQCYRNKCLADAMASLQMMDSVGYGIKRMFREQRRRYFPLPEYDTTNQNSVSLTIFGKIIDDKYSSALFEHKDLSLHEVLMLDYIQKGRSIPHDAALHLKKNGLAEGRYPNIYLAAGMAKESEKKAAYIKYRAFDDNYYEKLIINYIQQYREAAPKDIENLIYDKLSSILTHTQKKAKIRNLLQKMNKKGTITNNGKRSTAARWRIPTPKLDY